MFSPESEIGSRVAPAPHHRVAEHWMSIRQAGADPLAVFRDFPTRPGQVAGQLVFGGIGFHDKAMACLKGKDWPVMWLQGDSCSGAHLAGTQALLVQGARLRRMELDGRVVGSAWSDDDADYCLLAGLLPDDLTAPRPAQARRVFERLATVLEQNGMTFLHVVRTWLFLDQLLDWYDEFNAVRNAFFTGQGVFQHLVPASTGIGAGNPSGAALLAGALAVRPRHPAVKTVAVPSPLQCPALDYQSSFSRAAELQAPGRRRLMISGTASISPEGKSVHVDDVPQQIALTMEVVAAILASRRMGWRDVTRAIAYFQDMRAAPHLESYCRAHGLPDLPLVAAHATVCRRELLFEIELDAVSDRPA